MDISAWTPGTWAAIAAWATVAILLTTAALALRQVQEARKLREAQSRPFVVIDLDLYSVQGLIFLTVENFGHTLAQNVRVKPSPPFDSTLKPRPFEKSSFLTKGIPTLPPRKRIFMLFDLTIKRFSSGLPMTYEVVVQYQGPTGNNFVDKYTLDLELYRGQPQQAGKGLHEIAKNLEELKEHTKKWTRGVQGLDVFVTDNAAKDRQNLRWMKTPEPKDAAGPVERLLYRLHLLKNRVADRLNW